MTSDFSVVARNCSMSSGAATEGSNSGPAPGALSSSGTSGGTSYLTFIVGTEKLNVAMQIDIVAFNPPEKSARR